MSYSVLQWLLFFYIYCFIGWCFESAYVSLKKRRFVNRGFLKLPMLPIYGSGAIAILIVTIPVRDNLWLVWLFGMISATLLELVTGAVMELLFKVKYWDYSNQKFNYKGYICLSSSIAWGFLSLLLTEVIHEPIESVVLSVPLWLLITLISVISVLFVSDFAVSFKAAWDLRRLLEKLTAIRAQAQGLMNQLEQRSDEISEKISEARAQASERWDAANEEASARGDNAKEEASARWDNAKEEASVRWDAAKEEAAERLAAIREEYALKRKDEYSRLSKFRAFFIRRLLRDNPYAASGKFAEALDELREDIRRRHEERKKKR